MDIINSIRNILPKNALPKIDFNNRTTLKRHRDKAMWVVLQFDNYEENKAGKQSNRCIKLYAVFKILRRIIPEVSIKIGKSCLELSLKLNETAISADVSDLLMTYYGTVDWDKKQYLKYSQIALEQNELLLKERRVRIIYNNVRSNFARQINVKELPDYRKELIEIINNYDSYRIKLAGYHSLIAYYVVKNENDNVLNYSLEFYEYFKSIGKTQRAIGFLVTNAYSNINSENFNIAEQLLKTGLENSNPYSHNWHILYQLQIILYFRTSNFRQLELVNFQFEKISDFNMERLKIMRAYYEVLVKAGKVKSKGIFKTGRFLNNSPISYQDKGGNNINLIIIEFLYLLSNRKLDILIEQKQEAIYRYASIHLKGEEFIRERNFLLCLCVVIKSGFNVIRAENNAKGYLEKMKKGKKAIEVVPFELLWKVVLRIL